MGTATYDVTAPDGTHFEIEGPDDATDAELQAYVQSQLGATEKPLEFEVPLGAKKETVATPQPPPKPAPSAGNFYGSGYLRGLKDPIDALAQLVPRGVELVTSAGGLLPNPVSRWAGTEAGQVDEQVQRDNAAYELERLAEAYDVGGGEPGVDWARIAGNVVNPVTVAGGTALAGTIPRVAQAGAREALGRTALRGAVTGAGLGAAQPVTEGDFATEKAKQVALGAGLGVAGDTVARGAARVVRPETNAAARALLDEGVRVTPGGILGGGFKKAEDAATSLPILGDAIAAAQQRSFDDLNRAVANRALAPVGRAVPDNVPVGYELVSHVEDTLSNSYGNLLPRLQFRPDQRFAAEMQQIQQMTTLLPPQQARQFQTIVRDKLINHMTPQGNMNGESFKAAESSLRAAARGYRSSPDYDQRQLGAAFDALLDSLRGTLERVNPTHAQELRRINEGWANFARLRKAAGYVGADDGVFTPAMLQRAVREKSGGVDKSQFAKGEALMQDLSSAAKSTLPSKVPDSGTARRLLTNTAGLASAAVSPGIPLGLAGASALYSRPGQYVLRSALTERPDFADPLAELIRRYGQPVGTAAALPAFEPGR